MPEWVPTASWERPPWPQTDKHPAIFLSWNDADAFVKWLSAKEGKRYRLPTEAEWEYVCRGGTDTNFWWGDQPDTTGKVANVADEAFRKFFPVLQMGWETDDGHAFTSPVGSYQPNQFGIHDVIGNAWEWVNDFYSDPAEPVVDPQGPPTGVDKIARGGGFGNPTGQCTCAYRFRDLPENRFSGTGFRVVLEP
jgi:formylglycine-generating enzyme required for sulfatase activity